MLLTHIGLDIEWEISTYWVKRLNVSVSLIEIKQNVWKISDEESWEEKGDLVEGQWAQFDKHCLKDIFNLIFNQCMYASVLSPFTHVQLCNPIDCSPPASSVHGMLQARILEWVAMPFSRGSSRPRDQTWVSCSSCNCRRILYCWATGEALQSVQGISNSRLLGAQIILFPVGRGFDPCPKWSYFSRGKKSQSPIFF